MMLDFYEFILIKVKSKILFCLVFFWLRQDERFCIWLRKLILLNYQIQFSLIISEVVEKELTFEMGEENFQGFMNEYNSYKQG